MNSTRYKGTRPLGSSHAGGIVRFRLPQAIAPCAPEGLDFKHLIAQHASRQPHLDDAHHANETAPPSGRGGHCSAAAYTRTLPPRAAKGPDKRLVTSFIKRADSLADLKQILAEHREGLDHIHVSAWAIALVRQVDAVTTAAGAPYASHTEDRQQSATQQQHRQVKRQGLEPNQLQGSALTRPAAAAAGAHEEEGQRSEQQQQQQQGQRQRGRQAPSHQQRQQQLAGELSEQLLELMAAHHSSMGPQQLSVCVYSLGKLRLRRPRLLAALLQQALRRLPSFTPQGLASVLYGCALLGARPPSPWLRAWAAAATQRMPAANGQDLANMAWALGRLRHQPGEAWLAAFVAASGARLEALRADELVNTAWGMGAMRASPPRDWLAGLETSSQARLAQLQPQQLANLVWAVARMRHQPGSAWVRAAAAACERHAGAFTPQGLTTLLWALPRSAPHAPPRLHLLLQRQLQARAAAAALRPADIAVCLCASGRLGRQVLAPGLLELLEAQSLDQLQGFGPQDLASCAWGLARVGYLPGSAWMDAFLRSCHTQAHRFNHRQLAAVIWALARLKAAPGLHWVAAMLMEAAEQLPSFSPHSVASMLWGLAALGFKPNKEWMQEVLATAELQLMRFQADDFDGILGAMARMGYRPATSWLHRCARCAAAKAAAGTIGPGKRTKIDSALAALGYPHTLAQLERPAGGAQELQGDVGQPGQRKAAGQESRQLG